MEPREKIYLVSFGSSDTYRLDADISKQELLESPQSPLRKLVDKMRDALNHEFPSASIPAELLTPKVEEADAEKAEGYQPLDHDAESRLFASLALQWKNMADLRGLSIDAPFNDVGPDTQIG